MAVRIEPSTEELSATEVLGRVFPRARTYRIEVKSTVLDTAVATPRTVTLLTPDPQDRARDELYVGHHLVERGAWSADAGTLVWDCPIAGQRSHGSLRFIPDGTRGLGYVASGGGTASVGIQLAPVTYTCDLAAVDGAYYDTASHTLVWPDASAAAWTQAAWVPGAVKFGYQICSSIFIGQKTYQVVVTFTDLQTQAGWSPAEGSFSALLDSSMRFTFETQDDPAADDRSALPAPANAITSAFPYLLGFDMSGFADRLLGAMQTGSASAATGTVSGWRGVVDNPSAVGLYALDRAGGGSCVVGIADGKLIVDEQRVAGSRIDGNRLHWDGLPADAVAATGLPPTGWIELSDDGATVTAGNGVTGGRRVAPSEARAQGAGAQGGDSPAPTTLTSMSQYQQDSSGWSDVIRPKAMGDFYQILQYYMDPSLRKYLSPNPVTLDPAVQPIADLDGADGVTASTFYQQLSVPYLVQALSHADDPYAGKLNAVRARAWLSNSVSQASVYQAQVPELYAREWAVQFPDIGLFLSDQQDNQATYSDLIASDAQTWTQQAAQMIQDDPDRLADFQKMIADLATAGKAGRYWAYWYYRMATQPAALQTLQLMSLGGTSLDGSAYARQIQTNCALLNVLDPAGTFVQRYIEAIELFQLGNVLPQLIDYSGNTDEYGYAVQQVFQAFIAKYSDSTDPAIQQQVQDMQQALDQQWLGQVLDGFAGIASTFSGVYEWEQIATTFAEEWPKLSKIPIGIAKLVALGAVSAGIAGFVYGAVNWESEDEDTRTALIAGGLSLFVEITSAVLKRGVAWTAVLRSDGMSWMSMSKIFTGDAMALAESRLNTGFSRWLIQSGETPVGTSEMFGTTFLEAGEYEATTMTKIFGRNLDDFVATRLGAMFAIVNIVLSAIALSKPESEEETAANSLFLAAASLELIASVGSWGLAAAGVEAIGAFSVAAIASCVAAIAGFAAIAGIVIILILMFKHQPTPVEEFATGTASDGGYYMPQGVDIDYFQVVQTPGQPELLGVSIQDPASGKAVRMAADGTVSLAPPDHSPATAFFLKTDQNGHAQFLALLPPAAGSTTPTPVALAVANGALRAVAPAAGDTSQQWAASLVEMIAWTADNQHPVSGSFTLSSVAGGATPALAVSADGSGVTLAAGGTNWALTMVEIAPAGLTMGDLKLAGYETDGQYRPFLAQPASSPQTWTVSPALPAFLKLDAGTGTIAWAAPGTKPPPTATQTYTLSVTNDVGSDSTTFAIGVA